MTSSSRSLIETQKKIIQEEIRKQKSVISDKLIILKDAKTTTPVTIAELSF